MSKNGSRRVLAWPHVEQQMRESAIPPNMRHTGSEGKPERSKAHATPSTPLLPGSAASVSASDAALRLPGDAAAGEFAFVVVAAPVARFRSALIG